MDRPLTEATRVRMRAAAERTIRDWFRETDAVEVSVPTLVRCPGMEPHLRAFPVQGREVAWDGTRWLHTSPEYAIKSRFGSLGFDVYTFARAYRDEPVGRWHHPEFTMLEWYRRDVGLEVLMDDCEEIVARVVRACAAEARAVGHWVAPAEPQRPFRRISCEDACRRWANVDLFAPDDRTFAESAIRAGWDVGPTWDRDAVFTVLLADAVEPALCADGPAFLTGFPAWQSALARLDPEDPRCALRFELFLPGMARDDLLERACVEVANAFDELTDAQEQSDRFAREASYRHAEGLDEYAMPEALLQGLATMPRTSGIALGFERLLLWALEATTGHALNVGDALLGEPTRAARRLR
jgi:lysyl-tRNA synthetase class 2